jgi:malonyl CoA-acyl carrier protein transacylase
MQKKIAHIFPAFTLKYTGKETAILSKYAIDFNEKVDYISHILGRKIDFNIKEENYIHDELVNQLLSYSFSCSFSDLLKKNNAQVDYVSGFSMGIYAALYHSNAIDFKTGIQLITDIFNSAQSTIGSMKSEMLSVIGFEIDDLKRFIQAYQSIEIVIKNGKYSFVIAGLQNEIDALLPVLHEEGAIHINPFNVSIPYHHSIILKGKLKFKEILSQIKISDSQIPLVSMLNAKELVLASDLRRELLESIIGNLNFYDTIQKLNAMGVAQFIEVGAGTALLKSSKFIDGDFLFSSIAKGNVL